MPHSFPLSSVEERGKGGELGCVSGAKNLKGGEMLRFYRSSNMTEGIRLAIQGVALGYLNMAPSGSFFTIYFYIENKNFWHPIASPQGDISIIVSINGQMSKWTVKINFYVTKVLVGWETTRSCK